MKYVKRFQEVSEKLNINNVSDINVLETIEKLLKTGDINTIANIMTDYNSKVTEKLYKEATKLIDNSIHKEDINSLIRGKLGIFG